MTTSDARKRLAERNAATQADTSVEGVALRVLGEHVLRDTDPACSCGWDWDWREVILPSRVGFDPTRYRLPTDVRPTQHRAHVAAALADALNGAGVTGGGA